MKESRIMAVLGITLISGCIITDVTRDVNDNDVPNTRDSAEKRQSDKLPTL